MEQNIKAFLNENKKFKEYLIELIKYLKIFNEEYQKADKKRNKENKYERINNDEEYEQILYNQYNYTLSQVKDIDENDINTKLIEDTIKLLVTSEFYETEFYESYLQWWETNKTKNRYANKIDPKFSLPEDFGSYLDILKKYMKIPILRGIICFFFIELIHDYKYDVNKFLSIILKEILDENDIFFIANSFKFLYVIYEDRVICDKEKEIEILKVFSKLNLNLFFFKFSEIIERIESYRNSIFYVPFEDLYENVWSIFIDIFDSLSTEIFIDNFVLLFKVLINIPIYEGYKNNGPSKFFFNEFEKRFLEINNNPNNYQRMNDVILSMSNYLDTERIYKLKSPIINLLRINNSIGKFLPQPLKDLIDNFFEKIYDKENERINNLSEITENDTIFFIQWSYFKLKYFLRNYIISKSENRNMYDNIINNIKKIHYRYNKCNKYKRYFKYKNKIFIDNFFKICLNFLNLNDNNYKRFLPLAKYLTNSNKSLRFIRDSHNYTFFKFNLQSKKVQFIYDSWEKKYRTYDLNNLSFYDTYFSYKHSPFKKFWFKIYPENKNNLNGYRYPPKYKNENQRSFYSKKSRPTDWKYGQLFLNLYSSSYKNNIFYKAYHQVLNFQGHQDSVVKLSITKKKRNEYLELRIINLHQKKTLCSFIVKINEIKNMGKYDYKKFKSIFVPMKNMLESVYILHLKDKQRVYNDDNDDNDDRKIYFINLKTRKVQELKSVDFIKNLSVRGSYERIFSYSAKDKILYIHKIKNSNNSDPKFIQECKFLKFHSKIYFYIKVQ